MIESLKNEKIKHLQKLYSKNSFRKKENLFVVEGKQENNLAISFGYQTSHFFICEELYQQSIPNGIVQYVSSQVYDKIAYRGGTEGIIGVYHVKDKPLTEYKVKVNARIIVLEGIEKPGNLGAILRSAEAFGIDAVLLADSKVDLYNPNVIRSSVGCLFGMEVYSDSNEKVYSFLKKNEITIYTTNMAQDAKMIDTITFDESVAIIFGTEHSGLTEFWDDKERNTLIPMKGKIDSLNLSNAVAISCYEMTRNK